MVTARGDRLGCSNLPGTPAAPRHQAQLSGPWRSDKRRSGGACTCTLPPQRQALVWQAGCTRAAVAAQPAAESARVRRKATSACQRTQAFLAAGSAAASVPTGHAAPAITDSTSLTVRGTFVRLRLRQQNTHGSARV